MDKKQLIQFMNQQYIQNKQLEIELAKAKQKIDEQELATTETAVNVDYLVCLQDMNI